MRADSGRRAFTTMCGVPMNRALVCHSSARHSMGRFFTFAFVGSVGTAIQYAVLGFGVALNMAQPVVCSAVGYALGSVANYLLNYRLTFHCKAPHFQSAAKYFTVISVGWVINLCLMSLFVIRIGWSHWISQVLTTVIGLVWNYSGSNWWAYRVRGNTSGSATIAERSQAMIACQRQSLTGETPIDIGRRPHAPVVIQ